MNILKPCCTHPGKRTSGFTLIELMVVVAIVGVLSSFATAAYAQYIETANVGVLIDRHEKAIESISLRMVRAQQMVSMGLAGQVPADADAWIEIIGKNQQALESGPAFILGEGDAQLGAIGLQLAGSWSDQDLVITLTRPAYAGNEIKVSTIAQR